MKRLITLMLVLALAFGVWVWSGGLDRVTENRVHQALVGAGIPESMADCMAPKMVDRLSISQLRKLERLGPRDGEFAVPLSSSEALERIRRVGDNEALEVTATAAGGCAMRGVLEGL